MDADLGGLVKATESFWTFEDSKLLHITLTKVQQGEPWPSAIQGHDLDAITAQVRDPQVAELPLLIVPGLIVPGLIVPGLIVPGLIVPG